MKRMIKNYLALSLILFTLSACSSMSTTENILREPSAVNENVNCNEAIKRFFPSSNYEAKLQEKLVQKKLIGFSNKFVTVNHPRLEWINKASKAITRKLQNWNTNVYPQFFLLRSQDVVNDSQVLAEAYVLNKKFTSKQSQSKKDIAKWIANYKTYEQDINNLIKDRAVNQYNYAIVKKLKFKNVKDKKLELIFSRNGEQIRKFYEIDSEDALEKVKVELKRNLQHFDGSFVRNGAIKQRVIDQAFYKESLSIYLRELKLARDNAKAPSVALTEEIKRVTNLVKDDKLSPTTFGIYQINNTVFSYEMAHLAKLDVAYKKFVEKPQLKLEQIIEKYLKDKKIPGTEEQKIGLLKRVYLKITSLDKKKVAIGAGLAAGGAISHQIFFSFDEPEITEYESKGGNVLPVELDVQGKTSEEEKYSDLGNTDDLDEIFYDEITK